MHIKDQQRLDRVRAECRRLVTKRSSFSAATGALPGGIAGAASDIVNLRSLLPAINKKFGLDPTQVDELDEQMKEQVAVIVARIGSGFIGKLITEGMIATVLKQVGVRLATKTAASYVPVIGSGVAAGLSFGMMKLIGNKHVEDCYDVVGEMLAAQASPTAPSGAA